MKSLSGNNIKKVSFILLIIYIPFIFTPVIYQAVLMAEEDTLTLREKLQEWLTVLSSIFGALVVIADTIVEYENSIADDNRKLTEKQNTVTSITNDIGSLNQAQANAEANVRNLKQQIGGIDVDIAHENVTISTANYYIRNPDVSENVRSHWKNKRRQAQNRITDLESQKSDIQTQITSEENNIADIKKQINSKWNERSFVQEDISRINQNISMKKERVAYQRILLSEKNTEYLNAILAIDEIEREIAQVEADRAYYQSLLAAELAKSPSQQDQNWIQTLVLWIHNCNERLGDN